MPNAFQYVTMGRQAPNNTAVRAWQHTSARMASLVCSRAYVSLKELLFRHPVDELKNGGHTAKKVGCTAALLNCCTRKMVMGFSR